MLYIASPYTHEDPEVMERRYEEVFRFTQNLLQTGVVAFSPIVYGRAFHVREVMAGHYKAWQQFNDEMILRSDAVYVYQIPGWKTSKGVQHEIIFAKMNNVPVRFFSHTEADNENI